MTINEKILSLIANTIRGLSMDAIEAANSGHPGLPLGCAELFAYLYANELRLNVNDTDWINSDRFILSAGHGSMVYAAILHFGQNSIYHWMILKTLDKWVPQQLATLVS